MALFARRGQAEQKTEPVELDLTADEPVIRLGYPTDCPECGGRGYLDAIDVEARVQRQHCQQCNHRWETHVD